MTPLGVMAGALTPQGVGALVFAADPQAGFLDLQARLERRFPGAAWCESPANLAPLWQQVAVMLGASNSNSSGNSSNNKDSTDKIADSDSADDSAMPVKPLPDAGGTAFQQRVWRAISDIPEGHTASYRQLAACLGLPSGARAVAAACAANPLALLVPCHRVLAADGRLSGYRWGLERKRWLLQMERERRSGVASSPNASLQT